ncbi:MAG TPA: hypothetical protein VIW27_02975, partial [Gammaproteobacteria bacterium]
SRVEKAASLNVPAGTVTGKRGGVIFLSTVNIAQTNKRKVFNKNNYWKNFAPSIDTHEICTCEAGLRSARRFSIRRQRSKFDQLCKSLKLKEK